MPWDNYATHVPVLRALGRTLRPKQVVEFGSGRFSTFTFLNPVYFEDLESLISVENREDWATFVSREARDYRLKVLLAKLEDFDKIELPQPDLVLIDCGNSIQDYQVRVNLLHRYENDPHAMVVLHDVEDGALSIAFNRSKYRYRMVVTPLQPGPKTAILSNRQVVTEDGLRIDWSCDLEPITKRNVYACITSRDGKILDDVLMKVSAACVFAKRIGACNFEMGRSRDSYSTPACRNKAVQEFLKRPGFTHLWFIDDDVLVQEDSLAILLGARRPIAAGGYPQVRYPSPEQPPHLYVTIQVKEGWFSGWFEGEVEAIGAGTGCMLIERQVFEALPFPWFRWPEKIEEGEHRILSDDVDFCQRAALAGFKTYGLGRVRCGHLKPSDLAAWIGHGSKPQWKSDWTGPITIEEQVKRERACDEQSTK